jgi:hypothetical protein
MNKSRQRYRTVWHPCPTCGGRYSVGVKKGRSYVLSSGGDGRRPVAPIRVYWPVVQWRNPTRVCPDEYHNWQRYPSGRSRVEDENEHVASLPVLGRIPLRDEAKARAAATRKRNRLRQGKGTR